MITGISACIEQPAPFRVTSEDRILFAMPQRVHSQVLRCDQCVHSMHPVQSVHSQSMKG